MAHFHPFSIAMLDYQRVETSAIGRFWLIRVDPKTVMDQSQSIQMIWAKLAASYWDDSSY